jgi:hypothetical protein
MRGMEAVVVQTSTPVHLAPPSQSRKLASVGEELGEIGDGGALHDMYRTACRPVSTKRHNKHPVLISLCVCGISCVS